MLIVKDKRLRECDYGDLTQRPASEVDPEQLKRIKIPFPHGESYEQCLKRMKEFLDDLTKIGNGKKALIIGHRATQYGLEYWIKGLSLEEIISTPWNWQPGWTYHLDTTM